MENRRDKGEIRSIKTQLRFVLLFICPPAQYYLKKQTNKKIDFILTHELVIILSVFCLSCVRGDTQLTANMIKGCSDCIANVAHKHESHVHTYL